MLIAALFIITLIWKQPTCPLTDEWISKLYTPSGMLLSKKKGTPDTHNNLDQFQKHYMKQKKNKNTNP